MIGDHGDSVLVYAVSFVQSLKASLNNPRTENDSFEKVCVEMTIKICTETKIIITDVEKKKKIIYNDTCDECSRERPFFFLQIAYCEIRTQEHYVTRTGPSLGFVRPRAKILLNTF